MPSFFRRAGAEIARILQLAADPAAELTRLLLYTKAVAGVTQLFARSSDGNLGVATDGLAATALYSAGARPTITAASGSFRHLYAAVPDLSVVVPANGRLELAISEVETGVPSDFSVRVLLKPT